MAYITEVLRDSPLGYWPLDGVANSPDLSPKLSTSGGTNLRPAIPLGPYVSASSVIGTSARTSVNTTCLTIGDESNPHSMEVIVMPVTPASVVCGVVSNAASLYGGITIDMNNKLIKFGTVYANGENCTASYNYQINRRMHVVGVHTKDYNILYVDGQQVASVKITDTAKASNYLSGSQNLVFGRSASGYYAVNHVSIYGYALSPHRIYTHYLESIQPMDFAGPAAKYGGMRFKLTPSPENVYSYKLFTSDDDWNLGISSGVYPDNGVLKPYISSGVSLRGEWQTSIELGSNALNGVALRWRGENITVQTRIDNAAWTTAINGDLVSTIAVGSTPNTKLQINVIFASGVSSDSVWLDDLEVIVLKSSSLQSTDYRSVTITGAGYALWSDAPELAEISRLRMKSGGVFTIGASTATVPNNPMTIQMLIRANSALSTNASGTFYKNGVSVANLAAAAPVGEWSLVHIVLASPLTTSFTLTGDIDIRDITYYPTQLTSAQLLDITRGMLGKSTTRMATDGNIGLTSDINAIKTYSFDWPIVQSG